MVVDVAVVIVVDVSDVVGGDNETVVEEVVAEVVADVVAEDDEAVVEEVVADVVADVVIEDVEAVVKEVVADVVAEVVIGDVEAVVIVDIEVSVVVAVVVGHSTGAALQRPVVVAEETAAVDPSARVEGFESNRARMKSKPTAAYSIRPVRFPTKADLSFFTASRLEMLVVYTNWGLVAEGHS
jgi:hypothetical protein